MKLRLVSRFNFPTPISEKYGLKNTMHVLLCVKNTRKKIPDIVIMSL